MADGDEKIDHNDRVLVRNRISDAPTEAMFNGITIVWGPGQTRSIQRLEALHFVRKSVLHEDPTFQDPNVYALVLVNEAGEPTEPGTDASPLTAAQRKELTKFGTLNTRNLPPDRLVGGMPLVDEAGKPLGSNLALRGAPQAGGTLPIAVDA